MTWKINYAENAGQDLQDIYDYIADTLFDLVTAIKQTERITAAIDSLDNMPMRYRLYDREPWRSQGLRVMSVDNYVVLYVPDESNYTVTIIRIMYGGRDIDKHLNSPRQ